MFPERIYYEPKIVDYRLGQYLRDKYADKEWIPIQSHNNIPELRQNANTEFAKMKRYLIIGTRKTHKYAPNHKVSDYLVPYTSSGCSAMCMYCYLVCNYNKCSYLRLFVNREEMLMKMVKTGRESTEPMTFEIGSNSDLVLENTITDNLPWTITEFARLGQGHITFPTKFDMIDALLPLEHRGKTIFRMSVNPVEIIQRIEFGTSQLENRIKALNRMAEADYKVGMLIAPVVLLDDYQTIYGRLIDTLADTLSDKVKKTGFIEIIFMTYSYVHNAINSEAFPHAVQLYEQHKMTGRGRGKYTYREPLRHEAEAFLRGQLSEKLGSMPILYVV